MKRFAVGLTLISLVLVSTILYASKELFASATVAKVLDGWEVMTSENPPLDKKTFELIAIAVAANMHCDFCIKKHTKVARQLGITNAQIKHAVVVSGYMRMLKATLHRMDEPKELSLEKD